MSYSATKIYSTGYDIGTLLEPRRGVTKISDVKFAEASTDISNYFLDCAAINSNWRSVCAAALSGLRVVSTDLGSYFAKRGWVPGATVKVTYTSGSGTISPFTVDYQPDGSTGGTAYDVKRIAAFLCGGGGNGGGITSRNGAGGGAGSTSLFAILDWPDDAGLQNLFYSVGAAINDTYINYTYGAIKQVRSKAGNSGSGTTGGSTQAATVDWDSAIAIAQYTKSYAGGSGGTGGTSPQNGVAGAAGETVTFISGLSGVTIYQKSGGTKGANNVGYNSLVIYGGGGGGGAANLTSSGGAGGAGGNAPGNGVAASGIGCGGGGGSGTYISPGVSVPTTGGAGYSGVLSIFY